MMRKRKAKKRLGMFQGDITFSQMKNRLQQIASGILPYLPGQEFESAVSDRNINKFIGFREAAIDRTKLERDIFEDLTKINLDEGLKKPELPASKNSFGNDTDEDMLVDSGVDTPWTQYLNMYTRLAELVSSRISGIDSRISRLDERFVAMESDLEGKGTGTLNKVRPDGRSPRKASGKFQAIVISEKKIPILGKPGLHGIKITGVFWDVSLVKGNPLGKSFPPN